MPKVAVHYFNARGLGEGPRMLLAYGCQEFEDHRVEREDWPEFKPKTPFGQMPVLEWDGKMFSQSNAICRYLGHMYGLDGDNLEEDLEIDQNMDFFTELRMEAASVFYETDEELKAKKQEEAEQNEYPKMLQKFEEIVIKNDGHIALGRLTWGDFVIAGVYDALKRILQMPDLDEKYPNIKRIYENVTAINKVKAYIEASPKTEF
ncbi:glutathione S-transferase 2-like [Epargyreus clarus]|uniref:glutathione S-transferase 2-like n=1 Tax=Epargyreus clarus TaxID=520877 RepID=UPI003C2C57C1